jgi:hypothetical protein
LGSWLGDARAAVTRIDLFIEAVRPCGFQLESIEGGVILRT